MIAFGGRLHVAGALLVSFVGQVALFSVTLWLSIWVSKTQDALNSDIGFYLSVYASLIVGSTIIYGLSKLCFQFWAWRSARSLHQRLLKAILCVSLTWFDSNPPGRIINRFSQDMSSIDGSLIYPLQSTLEKSLRLLLRIGTMGSIMPLFAIPAAAMCLLGFFIGEMYTKAQSAVKKMDSAAWSPIFALFTETSAGMSIIRAHRKQKHFSLLLAHRLRHYARTQITQFSLNRWVAVRADATAAAVAFMAGWLALYKAENVPPGLVGFSLTSAIGLSSTVLQLVRHWNDLEINLTSFQRVQEYGFLEPEDQVVESQQQSCQLATVDAAAITDIATAIPGSPAAFSDFLNSTSQGPPQVEFRNVSVKYALDGPEVLTNVSFKIEKGEKVAIVGRTGGGKSTIAMSILRMTHITSGTILINGVDVTKIPLQKLRSGIAMAPQDPILFSGTVRDNLDMPNKIPEEVLANALGSCCELQPNVSVSSAGLTGTKDITLETLVCSRGDNLSQGQRQVLGIARTIARKSPIVILDEAMGALSNAADLSLQHVMDVHLQGATRINISHRLETVLDHDKIIVIANNTVQEQVIPILHLANTHADEHTQSWHTKRPVPSRRQILYHDPPQ